MNLNKVEYAQEIRPKHLIMLCIFSDFNGVYIAKIALVSGKNALNDVCLRNKET